VALAFSYQFVGKEAELRSENRLAAVDGDLAKMGRAGCCRAQTSCA
jgi:hypothetical protein